MHERCRLSALSPISGPAGLLGFAHLRPPDGGTPLTYRYGVHYFFSPDFSNNLDGDPSVVAVAVWSGLDT